MKFNSSRSNTKKKLTLDNLESSSFSLDKLRLSQKNTPMGKSNVREKNQVFSPPKKDQNLGKYSSLHSPSPRSESGFFIFLN